MEVRRWKLLSFLEGRAGSNKWFNITYSSRANDWNIFYALRILQISISRKKSLRQSNLQIVIGTNKLVRKSASQRSYRFGFHEFFASHTFSKDSTKNQVSE